MNDLTRDALEESIKHWKEVVAEPVRTRVGPAECALCTMFWGSGCNGCPVHERTGQISCVGSPFDKFYDAQSTVRWMRERGDAPSPLALENLVKLAKAELKFLRSLRPRKQKK